MILKAVFLFLIPICLGYVEDLPDRCPSTQDELFVYPKIQFPGLEPFQVRCYSDGEFGSGWMEVYFKFYDSWVFNLTYDQYINGFGHVAYQHFIGLEKLHILTNRKPHEVFIDILNYERGYRVRCENFVVGDRSEGYSLKRLDGCSEDTESLQLIQGTKFSTFDRDLDGSPDHNWAKELGFGFWFSAGKPILGKRKLLYLFIRRKD
ncbi:hypothetical protein KR067_011426 [Drosophila pandora]|nr:hypothetical protein KR067_011426 [Drosophila pandora]